MAYQDLSEILKVSQKNFSQKKTFISPKKTNTKKKKHFFGISKFMLT